MKKVKYHSVFISDCHLGMKGINSEPLLVFLKSFDCENLFLVGDIFDTWQRLSWPEVNNKIVKEIFNKISKGTKIFYVPGNHDEFLKNFNVTLNQVEISDQIIYTALNGKKYLITHGDFFDSVIQYARFLVLLGDQAYNFLFEVNKYLNKIRKFLGRDYWSLSQWGKNSVKSIVNFISQFESILTQEANRQGCRGVICGHIHNACIKDGFIEYMNCGDWVESFTAIVEDLDGNFKIIEGKR